VRELIKEIKMQFMLIFKETDNEVARRDDPEAASTYWGAWGAYVEAVQKSGIFINGNVLQPPHTAVQIRIADGKRQVQDGPFADTHEHLGGYFIIETVSLDDALEWAARAPCASAGSIEVRPILPQPTAVAA